MFTCVCFESVRSAPTVGILHTMQRRRLTSQLEDSRACFYLEIGKTWVGRAGGDYWCRTKFRSSTYTILLFISLVYWHAAPNLIIAIDLFYRKPGFLASCVTSFVPFITIYLQRLMCITLGAPSHITDTFSIYDSKMCLFEREVGRYHIEGRGKHYVGTIHGR